MKGASTSGSCRLKRCRVCSRARVVGYKVCTHRRQSAPSINLASANGDNQPPESASNGRPRRRSGPPSKRASVPFRPRSAAHIRPVPASIGPLPPLNSVQGEVGESAGTRYAMLRRHQEKTGLSWKLTGGPERHPIPRHPAARITTAYKLRQQPVRTPDA
jgi:hypothetical protein